ncbi:molybdenum ABC transporter ATP-binding protein [Jannaschia sp. LMIT008]|uniref:molybdenum ABC transporter ATP-binding protein n=1 Tax=Jannaschia maritima TaxID=3032585 RepID=UPI00281145CA|nr:molybdenum ABC transporter ATP-binding protein [Jannaschia sp. LMIT008]
MTLDIAVRLIRGGFELDVDLSLGAGVTALFGPSGAGKTSVARVVAGLDRPARARVALDGRDLSVLPPHRRGIGYVFQEPRLMPHLDVRRNLLFGAPSDDLADIPARLDLLHLLDRKPIHLSGGEAARVSLGRALLRRPRLLICDEPLAALDHRLRDRILPHFEGLRAGGVPVLYITHAMEEVARLADTLVLMRGGRVVRAGPVAALLSDPALAAVIGPRAAGAVLDGRVLSAMGGIARIETGAGVLSLPVDGAVPGGVVRVRIPATDVMLATVRPAGLSAMNVLPVEVAAIHPGEGPGAMLRLRAGKAHLLSRITQASLNRLGLVEGMPAWAIVKATAIARADIGG